MIVKLPALLVSLAALVPAPYVEGSQPRGDFAHPAENRPQHHGPRAPDSVLCDPAAWPLPVDGALCEAARKIAMLLQDDGDASGPRSLSSTSRSIRRVLFDSGVVDPHVRVRRVATPTYGSLFLGIEGAIADGAADSSHIGLAIAPEGRPEPSAIVLLARRLVHVEPFPGFLEPGDSFVLRGRTAAGTSAPVFWLGLESGPAVRVEARVGPEGFALPLGPFPPGRHFVEILVEAGEGPEVALLAPVQVGPREQGPGTDSVFDEQDDAGDEIVAVHQAVSDLRRRQGLKITRRDPNLDMLAQERSEAVASHGRLVHRGAPDTDAASKLAARGYAYVWAGENLATGPGVLDAFLGILESPAHRSLLEDPRAGRIGVGVHQQGERTWLAILLAEPMDAGAAVPFASAERFVESRMLFRAEDAIREARRGKRLPAIARDPTLDTLASVLSRHLSERDLPSDANAQAETRRRAFAADPSASAVSVEVVVGGRPEDLARAPAVVEDDCDRLGIGISSANSQRFGGERLWLTAICVHRRSSR